MIDEDIARAIHYPGCWDTVAYPTLASALWEMIDQDRCATCEKPFGILGEND